MKTAMPLQHREKLAQYLWTAFILMFFGIQAIIWTVAISFTANDPSHTVIEDYDTKSLKWDETQAELLASRNLKWKHELQVVPVGDVEGNQVVTLNFQDKHTQPIDGLVIQLNAYHRARAAEVYPVSLKRVSDGSYRGQIPVRFTGMWQFTGTAQRGDERYVLNERLFLELVRR